MRNRSFILFLLIFLFPGWANAQCTGIDFTSSKIVACQNDLIKFYAAGFPAGSSFKWYVNNQFEPGDDTLYKVFTQFGQFDVELQVTKPDNSVCTVKKTKYLTITRPVVNSLVVNKPLLCSFPDSVVFNASGTNVKSWNWIIDGNYYINKGNSMGFTFKSAGNKSVYLVVYDSNGCVNQFRNDSIVKVFEAPVVDFSDSFKSGCKPLGVNFKPEVDLKGNSISVSSWSFLGGTPSSSALLNPPVITYSNTGLFSVSFEITLSNGCKFRKDKSNEIAVGDSGTLNIFTTNHTLCPNDVVQVINLCKVDDKTHLTWYFYGGNFLPSSTADTFRVAYPTGGTFDVKVDYNYNGCSNTRTFSNFFNVNDLDASFAVNNPKNCLVPYTVSFNNTSKTPLTGTVSYMWRFYDTLGVNIIGTSTLQNPSRNYTQFGIYPVSLTITHSPSGCSETFTDPKAVSINPLLKQLRLTNPFSGCVDQSVSFSLPVSLYDYSLFPVSHFWTFYDLDRVTVKATSTLPNPYIYYDTNGNFDFKIRVTNNNGCSDSFRFNSYVRITDVVPDFWLTGNKACMNTLVRFYESTTPTGPRTNTWIMTHKDSSQLKITGSTSATSMNFKFDYPGIYHTKLITQTKGCVDSVEKFDVIEIGGVLADFTSPKTLLLEGEQVKMNLKIIKDQNLTGAPDTHFYRWKVFPRAGVATFDSISREPTIRFLKNGCYDIELSITNGSGCPYVVQKKGYICVGTNAIFNLPANVCIRDTLHATNLSLNAVSFKWSVSPPGKVLILPTDTSANPSFVFTDYGDYFIKLISRRLTSSDSVIKKVHVHRLNNDFYSSDTLKYCAPALVTFKVNKTDASVYHWYLGNGTSASTSDTFFTAIYLTNSGGYDTGYSIKMMAESNIGCKDSAFKEKYIKVIGPAPKFSILDRSGCNPLFVRFADSSSNVSNFVFQFGDGTDKYNAPFDTHTYSVKNPLIDRQVFYPILISMDTNGCNYVYSLDSVQVFKKPVAYFTASDTVGCQPFITSFFSNLPYTDQWEWDINADNTIDFTGAFPVDTFSKGIYTIKHRVSNKYGCSDSFSRLNYIQVFEKPEMDISVSDTTVCINDPVSFSPVIVSAKYPVTSYYWDFGDGTTTSDTSVVSNPVWQYQYAFSYDITLIVKDTHNCKDTVLKQDMIYAGDTNRLKTPKIVVVTVENNSSIRIKWNSEKNINFDEYQLFRFDGTNNVKIFSSPNPTDTQFLDNTVNVGSKRYIYFLYTLNLCRKPSNASPIHNSIWLRVSSTVHGQNSLAFNPYIGWDSLAGYRLYRKLPGDTSFSLFKILSATDSLFDDSRLCNQDYCYYVEAFKPSGSIISVSNQVCNVPVYDSPVNISLRKVSVIDENEILTEWLDSNITPVDHYMISRKTNNMPWVDDFKKVTIPSYTDLNVSTASSIYTYRIYAVDSCGVKGTAFSNEVNSMKLTLRPDRLNDVMVLDWNDYPDIIPAELVYFIELDDPSGGFKNVGTANSGNSVFKDEMDTVNTNRLFCYRVKAVFASDPNMTAFSNIVCDTIPSKMLIPNAFTPNGDGLNDVFRIFTRGLKFSEENSSYRFIVVNQWGEVVFETTDPNEGWDGKFNGETLPAGGYMYQVNARGLDGKTFNFSGLVYLIR